MCNCIIYHFLSHADSIHAGELLYKSYFLSHSSKLLNCQNVQTKNKSCIHIYLGNDFKKVILTALLFRYVIVRKRMSSVYMSKRQTQGKQNHCSIFSIVSVSLQSCNEFSLYVLALYIFMSANYIMWETLSFELMRKSNLTLWCQCLKYLNVNRESVFNPNESISSGLMTRQTRSRV